MKEVVTFRDIKLPKELSKKKKLTLYKCEIMEPLSKGDPTRSLEANLDCDRYAITTEQAVAYALTRLGSVRLEDLVAGAMEGTSDELHKLFFVVVSYTIKMDEMNKPILLTVNGMADDPQYDANKGVLSATLIDRYDEMHIKNYSLRDISINVAEGGEIDVDPASLKLDEIVISSAVTGGK